MIPYITTASNTPLSRLWYSPICLTMPFQLFDFPTGIQFANCFLTGLLASVHGYLSMLRKPNMLIPDNISCLLSATSSTTYTSTLWPSIPVLSCQYVKYMPGSLILDIRRRSLQSCLLFPGYLVQA